jgi:hypothetical protein
MSSGSPPVISLRLSETEEGHGTDDGVMKRSSEAEVMLSKINESLETMIINMAGQIKNALNLMA